jgi:signal transduction histidine kinase/CheY-like chemotaxis protein
MAKVIEGYVTHEFPSGAYVQILSKGYTNKRGFIPSGEIPKPFSGKKKLYVGDYVKAVEIGMYRELSKNENYFRLSISKLLEGIQNEKIPHPLKGKNLLNNSSYQYVKGLIDEPGEKWMKILRFAPKKIKSILLVDDQKELGEKTFKLIKGLGYCADWIDKPDLCLEKVINGTIDLILMDFTLGKSTNGFEESKLILSAMSNLPPRIVIFTRDDPYNLIQKVDELSSESYNIDKDNQFPLSQLGGIYCGSLEKNILQKLIELVEEGYYISNLYEDGDEERVSEEWMKRIKNSFDSGVSISDRIHIYLKKIEEKLTFQYIGIFRFDHVTKEVTLVDDININHDEYNRVKKDLPYSLIRDVIEEGKVKYFHDLEIWQMIDIFKHLLSLFGNWVRNFLGIPLIATGLTEHGLFIVNFKSKESLERILDLISNETLMIASIIERNRFQEVIESEQKFILMGKIRSTFVHELRAASEIFFYELEKFKEEQDKKKGNQELLNYFNEMLPKLFEKKNKIADIFEMFKIFSRDTVRSCRLNDFLDYIIDHLLWDESQTREVKIQRDYAKNIPKMKINTGRLQQVIVNLMLNAFDHMTNSPCKEVILSAAFNHRSKSRQIEIRVTDTACGIHRKDFDKIFEPFFTTKPNGTGLGLFISRALVGSMASELVVENSWPYIGSTFLIALPYIPSEE